MPPIRTHEEIYTEMDDDDGMPPLVDNPNPHPSMSYTFFTDMTPITADSAEPTFYEMAPETSILAGPDSPNFYDGPMPASSEVRTHSKKRDASYIPRPPNAFILFRSSFIKSQQVPGKVEGNHSTLSKIIGMYWKTLPREEREIWEAKALVAQAEHRKRYPDWRFRPGSNALAKLKVKDGPGTTKKRSSQSNRKGRGDTEVKEKSDEKRCAKIADFLVEGKKGVDLEAALKEWEGDAVREVKVKVVKERVTTAKKERGRGAQSTGKRNASKDNLRAGNQEVLPTTQELPITGIVAEDIAAAYKAETTDASYKTRGVSPDAQPDLRFKVPLTAMFKRSLSAPASQTRSPCPIGSPLYATRRNSCASVASQTIPCSFEESSQMTPFEQQHEAVVPRAPTCSGSDDIASEKSMDCLSPLTLSPVFERETLAHWSEPFDFPMSTSDPGSPGFGYDSASPAPSPVVSVFDNFTFPTPAPSEIGNKASHDAIGMDEDGVYQQGYTAYDSSFSTLKGWAGDMALRCPPRALGDLSFFVDGLASMDPVASDYDWSQGTYGGSFRASVHSQSSQQRNSDGLTDFSLGDPISVV